MAPHVLQALVSTTARCAVGTPIVLLKLSSLMNIGMACAGLTHGAGVNPFIEVSRYLEACTLFEKS